MSEVLAPSMGERWRRVTTSVVEGKKLELALASLPSIGNPRIRIQSGAIQAEMEGVMGALNEVSIRVPPLPSKIWPQVVRVMRRSQSMRDSLRKGTVPLSFDRLVARIAGEAVFPEARQVTSACTCGEIDPPCRHVLALHELYSRRLEDKPWELLTLRGVPLRDLLEQAERQPDGDELPPLALGAKEEPVLFPEGERGELDMVLSVGQIRSLLGSHQQTAQQVVRATIDAFLSPEPAEAEAVDEESPDSDGAEG
ncbi:MAG: hypothetical protein AAF196_01565 [Planctomycetota bacterium]